MRKIFLNAAALSLALITVSPALQSCKDYDDDITNINGVTDDISKQILDLQKQVDDLSEAQKNAMTAAANAANAAEAARKLADEALQAGNKAEADALAAQAMASDAKAAAEKAKADMLAQLTKEAQDLKNLISANSNDIKSATEAIAKNATAIAELDGKIAAVDAKLANYSTTADMVDAINKAITDNNVDINNKIDAEAAKIMEQVNALATRTTAIETQQATLESYITALQTNYTTLSTKVEGLSSKIDAQQTAIEGIQTELSSIQTQLSTLSANMTGFETKLNALDTKLTTVSSKVTTLENELNTLTSILLPGRLSSVTLVPNLYIGGIPTIEFMTISYNQWEADADKTGIYNVTENKFEITSNDAIAHYRLNPSTVSEKDINIDELSYVSTRAISRADEQPALNVSKAAINDGILDVWVKNNNAGKLTDDSKSEITIAALKVPIAKEHLFDSEKTTGASVYSEYSRVAESYITPVIKAIPSKDVEGYELTQYNLEEFANNSNIDAALPGKDFVAIDVAYNGEGQDLLAIVEGQYNDPAIVVSKEELNAWGLDFEFVLFGKDLCPAVEYASIEGTTIKAIAPEGAKLSDAIGKTPWIAVLLKDTANDKIIDVQYVQVKFVQDIRPVVVTYTDELALFCGEKEITVDWKWMEENILSKLNATNAMTPEEFISIYTNTEIVAKAPNGDEVNDNLVVVYDPETAAYKWTVSSIDLDMSKLENQKFVGEIVCKDPNELYPEVTVKIEITVNISEKDMPVLNAGSIYWAQADDKLQYILAYPTDPRNASADQVAEYNTNILQGRLSPYFNNMLNCAHWGTYFNDSKYVNEEAPYVWFTTEYSDPAKTFVNGDLPYGKEALAGLSLNFWIDNNEAGIAMVQNEDKVLVDWKANLVGNDNSNNGQTFGQCWIYVKQPLYYQQIKSLSITDNVGASVTCDLTNSWKVTDYYDNVVVNTQSYNYRDFYVLENIEYNVKDAFMTRGESATSDIIGTCADFKVAVNIENNTLTYTNMGAILLEECYIQIPVSLPHRWGVLKGTISVKLNPLK